MLIVDALESTRRETLERFQLGDPELKRRYAPGKWTIRFLLHHLADAETVLFDRIRRVLSEPRGVVWAFDQDAWARGLNYDHRPVDLSRKLAWIHPDQAKARKAIPVPLNETAMQVLRAQKGQHKIFVFTFRGEKILQTSGAAWYRALKRAGIEDFRWHDLRHTWASGTCRTERRSSRYRRLRAGKPRRWYGAMRIWQPNISRSMPTTWNVMAQIWHNTRIARMRARCKHSKEKKICGGQGWN